MFRFLTRKSAHLSVPTPQAPQTPTYGGRPQPLPCDLVRTDWLLAGGPLFY